MGRESPYFARGDQILKKIVRKAASGLNYTNLIKKNNFHSYLVTFVNDKEMNNRHNNTFPLKTIVCPKERLKFKERNNFNATTTTTIKTSTNPRSENIQN